MSGENSPDDRTRSFTVIAEGAQVSRYTVLRRIGTGGMGEVYLADDPELQRQVALKFLPSHMCSDEDSRKRFKREAQAAAKLSHPNIVTIYEVGEYSGRPWFSMEHVPGGTLRDYVGANRLNDDQILEMASGLCSGLRRAHEAGIIHRDIKPTNILVDPEGRPKILDFGLATVRGTEALTREGSTLGTIGYMSPEQVQGRQVDQRSDLFSLGVLLHELVTGQQPFARANDAATMQAILSEAPPPLGRSDSELMTGFGAIIERALDKDIETRYQTAAGMLADIKRLQRVSDPSLVARSQVTVGAPAAGTRSRWPQFAVIGLVVLVVAAAAWFLPSWTRDGGGSASLAAADGKWKNSIAVLPFRDFSSTKDQEYFCDGVTDAIIGKLSTLDGLKVISMTSVMQYKSRDRDLRKIGDELGVSTVLEGSLQKEGDRIRVRAQLINVNDDAHLWSQTYDREVASVFDVQDDISRNIADKMKLQLLGGKSAPRADRGTTDIEAYNAYLHGRFQWRKRNEESIRSAIEYFERAIKLDHNYALAYSGLADAWAVLPGYSRYPTEEANIKADSAARRALELDPRSAEAHASLGLVLHDKRDYPGAEKEFQTALELNPGYVWAHTWYSNTLNMMGKRAERLEQLEIAHQLDPLQIVNIFNLAHVRRSRCDYKGALELYRKISDIQPNPTASYYTGLVLGTLGRYDEAVKEYRHCIDQFPYFAAAYNNLANLYADLNDTTSAFELLDHYPAGAADSAAPLYLRADIYHSRGLMDKALEQHRLAYKLDPHYLDHYWEWAQTYAGLRQWDSAAAVIDRLEEVADRPEIEPEFRGSLAFWKGDLQTALTEFSRAAELRDGPSRNFSLVTVQVMLRKFDDLDLQFGLPGGGLQAEIASGLNEARANVLALQGQFDDAIAKVDSNLESDQELELYENTIGNRLLKAFICEARGEWDAAARAAKDIERASYKIHPAERYRWRGYQAYLLARAGQVAEARRVAEAMKAEILSSPIGGPADLWYEHAFGAISLVEGKYDDAVRQLTRAGGQHKDPFSDGYFQTHLLLGRAYLESGQNDRAIAEYEDVLSRYSNAYAQRLMWMIVAHYCLGLAYENAGRPARAAEQYREFLSWWEDANPGVPAMDDARRRLARLSG